MSADIDISSYVSGEDKMLYFRQVSRAHVALTPTFFKGINVMNNAK